MVETTVKKCAHGEPLGIGLAWHFGARAQHDGGGVGIQAKLQIYMKDEFAMVFMANRAGYDRNELAAAANVVFSTMG